MHSASIAIRAASAGFSGDAATDGGCTRHVEFTIVPDATTAVLGAAVTDERRAGHLDLIAGVVVAGNTSSNICGAAVDAASGHGEAGVL